MSSAALREGMIVADLSDALQSQKLAPAFELKASLKLPARDGIAEENTHAAFLLIRIILGQQLCPLCATGHKLTCKRRTGGSASYVSELLLACALPHLDREISLRPAMRTEIQHDVSTVRSALIRSGSMRDRPASE